MESAEGRARATPDGSAPRWLFATAALAPIAAGGLLIAVGARALRTPWAGETLALAHLGTIGFLVLGLAGALFRALPDAATATRAGVPLWRAFHAGACLGLVGLAGGFLSGARPLFFAALALLFASVLVLLIAVVPPLRGSRAPGAPALRTGVASLALAVFLGAWMGHAHVGVVLPGDRALWLQVHLSIGLLGFAGGLLGALAPGSPPRRSDALIRLGVALLALCWAAALAFGSHGAGVRASTAAGFAALPAAIAVWVLRPWAALRARRATGWLRASAWMGIVTAAAGCAALAGGDPRAQLLFGWLAIWGWAGLFVHGLIRGELSTDAAAGGRGAAAFHFAGLLAGAAAIALGDDGLARATGAILVVSGAATAGGRLRLVSDA